MATPGDILSISAQLVVRCYFCGQYSVRVREAGSLYPATLNCASCRRPLAVRHWSVADEAPVMNVPLDKRVGKYSMEEVMHG